MFSKSSTTLKSYVSDSMPLGGGDIGINTWYEDGKLPSEMNAEPETRQAWIR